MNVGVAKSKEGGERVGRKMEDPKCARTQQGQLGCRVRFMWHGKDEACKTHLKRERAPVVWYSWMSTKSNCDCRGLRMEVIRCVSNGHH